MAYPIPTTFTKYELTEEETKAGQTLTTQNKQVLQNLLSDTAEMKLNLIFDPTRPSDFIQNEAALAGQIKILRLILESSESVSPSLSL